MPTEPRYKEWLDRVYGGADNDVLELAYDEWAGDYDGDVGALGHLDPAVVAGMVGLHLAADAGEIFDVGAGTGIIGEMLAALGLGRFPCPRNAASPRQPAMLDHHAGNGIENAPGEQDGNQDDEPGRPRGIGEREPYLHLHPPQERRDRVRGGEAQRQRKGEHDYDEQQLAADERFLLFRHYPHP